MKAEPLNFESAPQQTSLSLSKHGLQRASNSMECLKNVIWAQDVIELVESGGAWGPHKHLMLQKPGLPSLKTRLFPLR